MLLSGLPNVSHMSQMQQSQGQTPVLLTPKLRAVSAQLLSNCPIVSGFLTLELVPASEWKKLLCFCPHPHPSTCLCLIPIYPLGLTLDITSPKEPFLTSPNPPLLHPPGLCAVCHTILRYFPHPFIVLYCNLLFVFLPLPAQKAILHVHHSIPSTYDWACLEHGRGYQIFDE